MSTTEPGRRVIDGRFELVTRLGGGGMGWVWKARDLVLHREVAVKEVRPPDRDLAEYDPEAARMLRERVLREARALARLHHPHVVTIHHIVDGGEGTYPWIVMEMVTGGSLQDRLDRGSMAPAEAARLGRAVLDALRAAHAAGIEHRDVKPANVLLRPDGRPVLTDFGIAAVREATSLTATGSVIGSPDYMAPERIGGKEGGPASDLWSLGMMLYVAVEAHHPLRRGSTLATLAAVLSEEVPPPREAGPLTPVLMALLVKDPLARPDAETVDRMLAAVEDPEAPAASGPAAGAATGPAPGPIPAHGAASGSAPGSAPAAAGAGSGSVAGPTPADVTPSDATPSDAIPYGSGPYGSAPAQGFGPPPAFGPPGHAGNATSYHLAPPPAPGQAAQGGGTGAWSPAGPGGPGTPAPGQAPLPATTVTGTRTRRRPLAVVAAAAAVTLVSVVVWTQLPDDDGTKGSGAAASSSPSAPDRGKQKTPAGTGEDDDKPGSNDDKDSDDTAGGDGGDETVKNLLTEDGLRSTVAKFKAVMGGSKVTRFVVYPTYAVAEAPVKGKEKLYDRYTYRGGDVAVKEGPGGTIMSGDGPADLDDFAWDAVPDLIRKAEKSLGVDDPTSRYLVINPPGVFDNEQTISVYLSDDYGSGYLKANAKGQVISTYPRQGG